MFRRFLIYSLGWISLSALAPESTPALELKTGDLILQSHSCYLCSLIEMEEASPYSHIGIIVEENGNYSVLESWNLVRQVNLTEFLKLRRSGTQSLILRSPLLNPTSFNAEVALERFRRDFEFRSYDPEFSWFNRDDSGEKYYCSEFVLKFLSPELPLFPKAMHFDKNRAEWMRYFRGTLPEGEPGISPGDFERSPIFKQIGFI